MVLACRQKRTSASGRNVPVTTCPGFGKVCPSPSLTVSTVTPAFTTWDLLDRTLCTRASAPRFRNEAKGLPVNALKWLAAMGRVGSVPLPSKPSVSLPYDLSIRRYPRCVPSDVPAVHCLRLRTCFVCLLSSLRRLLCALARELARPPHPDPRRHTFHDTPIPDRNSIFPALQRRTRGGMSQRLHARVATSASLCFSEGNPDVGFGVSYPTSCTYVASLVRTTRRHALHFARRSRRSVARKSRKERRDGWRRCSSRRPPGAKRNASARSRATAVWNGWVRDAGLRTQEHERRSSRSWKHCAACEAFENEHALRWRSRVHLQGPAMDPRSTCGGILDRCQRHRG